LNVEQRAKFRRALIQEDSELLFNTICPGRNQTPGSAIAMFFAGRMTGKLAGTTSSAEGAQHGLVLFGFIVTAAVVLTIWGSILLAGFSAAGVMARPNVPTLFPENGW